MPLFPVRRTDKPMMAADTEREQRKSFGGFSFVCVCVCVFSKIFSRQFLFLGIFQSVLVCIAWIVAHALWGDTGLSASKLDFPPHRQTHSEKRTPRAVKSKDVEMLL